MFFDTSLFCARAYRVVQLDLFIDFFWIGLACRLNNSLIARFWCFCRFRGTPILAGGIGVARAVVGLLSGVFSLFRASVSQ